MLDPSYITHPHGESLRHLEAHLERMYKEALPRHLGKVSIFSLSDIDTEKHPAQRMNVIGRRSSVAEPVTLRALGMAAFGNNIVDAYMEAWMESRQTLADTIELLRQGEHVMLGTTHQRTDDIAAILGTFEVALQEFSASRRHERLQLPENFRAQLVIGKLITGLNALGNLYVPDLLLVEGDTYYTLPHTPTVLEAGFSEDDCSYFNSAVNEAMEEDEKTHNSGIVRGVALSGSTFVYVGRWFGKKKRPPTSHARPISRNTAQLMARHHVIPVAANIEASKQYGPDLAILPIVSHPTDSECHELSEELMQEMRRLTGVEHTYHRSKDTFKEEALVYHIGDKHIPGRQRKEQN